MKIYSVIISKSISLLKILTICAFVASLLYLLQNAPFTQHTERVIPTTTYREISTYTYSENIVYKPINIEVVSDFIGSGEDRKYASVTTYDFHHQLFLSQLFTVILIFGSVYLGLVLLNNLLASPKSLNERSGLNV